MIYLLSLFIIGLYILFWKHGTWLCNNSAEMSKLRSEISWMKRKLEEKQDKPKLDIGGKHEFGHDYD